MAEEESNYDKICNYFQTDIPYSREEIIKGLIELGIAPEGKGLLNKLGRGFSFRAIRSKQVEETVMQAKFMRINKHFKLYCLRTWCNNF